jgi:hypothetical protein
MKSQGVVRPYRRIDSAELVEMVAFVRIRVVPLQSPGVLLH